MCTRQRLTTPEKLLLLARKNKIIQFDFGTDAVAGSDGGDDGDGGGGASIWLKI